LTLGVPTREAILDDEGRMRRRWTEFMQQVMDQPLREITDSSASPSAPAMKKYETIVFKATGVSKTYLVYYDGSHHYYWESDSTDLY